MSQKMKSMKKSGKYIICGLAAGVVLASLTNRRKFDRQIKDNVSMSQYRNRLIEFYGQEDVDEVFKEMNYYIGFGLSPSTAFELITTESND